MPSKIEVISNDAPLFGGPFAVFSPNRLKSLAVFLFFIAVFVGQSAMS